LSRHGDDDFSETKYVSISISETSFEVGTGGSVYSSGVGSDSVSGPRWLIEVGGYKDRTYQVDVDVLEDQVAEFLNLGAQITVSDESAIDYENDDSETDPN
jgi:hypothetical protein